MLRPYNTRRFDASAAIRYRSPPFPVYSAAVHFLRCVLAEWALVRPRLVRTRFGPCLPAARRRLVWLGHHGCRPRSAVGCTPAPRERGGRRVRHRLRRRPRRTRHRARSPHHAPRRRCWSLARGLRLPRFRAGLARGPPAGLFSWRAVCSTGRRMLWADTVPRTSTSGLRNADLPWRTAAQAPVAVRRAATASGFRHAPVGRACPCPARSAPLLCDLVICAISLAGIQSAFRRARGSDAPTRCVLGAWRWGASRVRVPLEDHSRPRDRAALCGGPRGGGAVVRRVGTLQREGRGRSRSRSAASCGCAAIRMLRLLHARTAVLIRRRATRSAQRD